MKHTICYTSKAIDGLGTDSVEMIFLSTQQNNYAKGISGVLLFGLGSFLQVLEGDKKQVLDLYENTIAQDPRHKELFEIINRPTDASIFEDYNSTFNIIKTPQEYEQLRKYLQHNRGNSTIEKLERLIQPFINFQL
jgi:hypothetical protein